MKTPMQTLALVAALALFAGAAQAENRSCLTDPPAPAARQIAPAEMSKIESALRAGQITPYEAGRLMRQQWELLQFQRGFLGADPAVGRGSGGCGLGAIGSDIDLAPLRAMARDMAKNGMQTATTVLRVIQKEAERLIQEKDATEAPEL
jgi:hypothetical protein